MKRSELNEIIREGEKFIVDMVSRFPDVEEDEPPYRLIVPDYAKL